MEYGGKGCLEIEQKFLVCAVWYVGKFCGIGILSNTNFVNLCSIFPPSLASIVKWFQFISKNKEISYYDLMIIVSYNH